jgi:hypothetical protein
MKIGKKSKKIMIETFVFAMELEGKFKNKLWADKLQKLVAFLVSDSGLPDFSWHNVPKRGENIPNLP